MLPAACSRAQTYLYTLVVEVASMFAVLNDIAMVGMFSVCMLLQESNHSKGMVLADFPGL